MANQGLDEAARGVRGSALGLALSHDVFVARPVLWRKRHNDGHFFLASMIAIGREQVTLVDI